MKPQLIIQDFDGQGRHNSDPDATRMRLIRGGSWKKQRIVVLVPSAELISAKVMFTFWNLGFPPNNGVAKILALGQEVGEAYSNAIASVLSHPELSQWEYLLTIEADNMPPGDGVIKLIESMELHDGTHEGKPKFDCIGGLYYTKGEGGVPQIWGDPRDPIINFRPQLPDPTGGLVECCGTGMGFNLWRLGMFKDERLRRPWFVTQKKDGLATQDLYFWGDARKYGYRCAIDCSVKVGHYDLEGKFGPPDTVW